MAEHRPLNNEPGTVSTDPVGGRNLRWLGAGVAILALATGAAYYFWPRTEPPVVPTPPAPVSDSPYLNTKSNVKYVGDQACADCHGDIAATYGHHPMGQSMFALKTAPIDEPLDAKANNPFQHGAFNYQVVRDGDRFLHKEWCQDAKGTIVAQKEAVVEYVVGSGAQAKTYLFQRDAAFFQSPIVWYTQKSAWGLSPGFEKQNYHMSRRIDPRCVYCHCHEAHHIEGTANQYGNPPFGRTTIGCERCHGPGELHVASRMQGRAEEPDLTIVNPRKLIPHLRDAVCEQCHLQGEALVVRRGRAQTDFRPGLPLHDYWTVLVRTPEAADSSMIVTHVEQMHASVCFQKSDGKFGCISCHDPHRRPGEKEKEAYFRQRCQKCHGTEPPAKAMAVKARECKLSLADRRTQARDNCVTCHMPRGTSSTGNHLAVTNHRVLRKPLRGTNPKAAPGTAQTPLAAFHRNLPGLDADEQARDLGIGLMDVAQIAEGLGSNQMRDFLSSQALPLLDRSVKRAPDDVAALEAQAFALNAQARPDEAIKVLIQAVKLAPERETTLTFATRLAAELSRLDLAATWGQRLVEKYPHHAGHHLQLAVVHARAQAWPLALKSAQAALAADPFDPKARSMLIAAYLETGNHKEAQAEFDVLGVIDPEQHGKMRAWFQERIRK